MSSKKPAAGLDYRGAGVDIDAGNALVEQIRSVARHTRRSEVLGGLGGFAALFELGGNYRQPVLVSATDGVGTKLMLARDLGRHHGIGIDLVAMCVNDLAVCGAQPLFFLDYYATGKLSVATAAAVVEGIGEGCSLAGCALVGGETAEMPGLYQGEDYDLAGFCVGVVEKSKIIDGNDVCSGDILLALASSGPHANGYSLIRKILALSGADLGTSLAGSSLGEILLQPTRIYVQSLLDLQRSIPVKAMAHITGGGLLENLPRVLPEQYCAVLDGDSWQWPEIFCWLQQQGRIESREMYRTFNCGVGMVICVAPDHVDSALAQLQRQGERAWAIGEVSECRAGGDRVVLKDP